ncbi:MAG: sulfatase-like hydrolase/transferase [Opitutaceae bacterium]|nr:sulfatase-like hydrolase/transferase [Opitutaceae bacterium]
MAEDLSLSNLAPCGGEIGMTHLNGLAREGLAFHLFQNTRRCCPTRTALMTGLYPHQSGISPTAWPAHAASAAPSSESTARTSAARRSAKRKSSKHEGGISSPCIAWWPAGIPAISADNG